MLIKLKLFLFTLAVTGLVFFFLWKINYPRKFRYKQLLYPLLALLYSGAVYYLYWKYHLHIHAVAIKLLNGVVGLFISPLPGDWGKLPAYMASLLMVLVFALLKSLVSLVFYLGLLLRFLRDKLFKKKKKGTQGQKADNVIAKFNLAYKIDLEAEIVLREQWEFIFLFLKKFALIIAALIFLVILGLHLVEPPLEMPLMSALALMIVLEGAWYLNGPRSGFYPPDLSGKEALSKKTGDYTRLWEEYQQKWKEKLLYARQYDTTPHPPVQVEDLPGIFPGSEENSEELTAAAVSLLQSGCTLTPQDCYIMKELYRYSDIIIAGAGYNHIAPVVISSFIRSIKRGSNILILIPYSNLHHSSYTQDFTAWAKSWFTRLALEDNVGEINFFFRGDAIDEGDRILIANADDLLEERILGGEWFFNIKTVLFIDVTEIFARSLTSASILLTILRKQNQHLRRVILSSYRQALEPSVRRNLDLDIKGGSEIKVLKEKPSLTHLLGWQSEGGNTFQKKLLAGDIEKFLGAEAVLAVLPWRDNLENLFLLGQEKICWQEYLEELENHKGSLEEKKVNPGGGETGLATIMGTQAFERITCNSISYLTDRTNRMILFSRDHEHNLAVNLLKSGLYAGQEMLLHIVSPPYLLREYLARSLDYFYKTPIFALTGKMMVSRFSLALSLMERLILEGLSEAEILENLRRIIREAKDAAKEIKELFLQAFEIDIRRRDYLTIVSETVFKRGRYEEQQIFRLSPEIKKELKLDWLKKVKINNLHNHTLGEIYRDHLYQNYLPGQVLAFSRKPYRIDGYDRQSSILTVSNTSPVNVAAYRPELQVVLNRLREPCSEENRYTETVNNLDILLELNEANFDITTSGYHFVEGENWRYKAIAREEIQRYYPLGRVLKIDLQPGKQGTTDGAAVSLNLQLLLQELLVSLYPETHQYIVVCSPTADQGVIGRHRRLFPSFSDSTAGKVKRAESKTVKRSGIRLYLFEDSHQDMGLLQSIFDNWQYIFKVMDDYIAWVLEAGEGEEDKKPGSAGSSYLKFNSSAIPDFIDLGITGAFLRQLLGENDLTGARRDFQRRQAEEKQQEKENQEKPVPTPGVEDLRRCDFCARPLPGAEIEVLADGRERCKGCRDTAINHIDFPGGLDLKRVYAEAREYFKKELKLELRKNIALELTTAEEINRHVGEAFKPTGSFDPRVLGYAEARDNKYVIKTENGSPYHLTLAALVHELTHIWQSDHLDCRKMKAQYGLLLLEGQAVWAELNCLAVKGMAVEFREQTANRADEYGEGYRLVLKLLREHQGFDHPFGLLEKLYPL